MAKKTHGLGRGLDSILRVPELEDALEQQNTATVVAAISCIPLDKIVANPHQPRKEFDEIALNELAQSIREQGVITPITVRRQSDNTYQLIAGERRFRASKIAGLTEIPAYIRVATDGQMMEMALVENIQRENLNAMEIALSYNALIEECKLTHEQMSERVGKNRSTITNYLRLLKLPSETQIALTSDIISMAHARALASVEDTDKHLEILHEIIDKHLSVRQTEQRVNSIKKDQQPNLVKAKEALPQSYVDHKQQLKEILQSEIDVKRSRRGKGTLTIHFNSDADFERIIKLLNK